MLARIRWDYREVAATHRLRKIVSASAEHADRADSADCAERSKPADDADLRMAILQITNLSLPKHATATNWTPRDPVGWGV